MRPANGAKIHSTSPNRYSPCSWALRPAPIFFWLGVTSKTPAPVPMLGGSAGDPSVAKEPNGICAATGGAVAMPNARSEAAPSHVMNLFLTVFPQPRSRPGLRSRLFILKRKPCSASKTNRQAQIPFIRSVARTSCSRIPGSIAECPASGTIRYLASGQARASSSALPIGQTMS